MSERGFKGVWIPAALWLDRNLSITEKVMLVEIDSLDAGPRGCYASNAHFAEFSVCRSRACRKLSMALHAWGLLQSSKSAMGNATLSVE